VNKGMKVYTQDGNAAVEFYSIKRDGDKLIMDVKILDAMRMDMTLPLDSFLNGLRIVLSWNLISFILLLPYFIVKRSLAGS
jgi:hypothetical protein